MTTLHYIPLVNKRLSNLLASIETFVTVKYVRNRGQIVKNGCFYMKVLSFAISDRISWFISVSTNSHFHDLQCFQKTKKNVCDSQK